jgi:hypothetical protein
MDKLFDVEESKKIGSEFPTISIIAKNIKPDGSKFCQITDLIKDLKYKAHIQIDLSNSQIFEYISHFQTILNEMKIHEDNTYVQSLQLVLPETIQSFWLYFIMPIIGKSLADNFIVSFNK